ncbi:MAG: AMP-binding protein [Methanobrevibacter sp.]|jgi:non-ribosomal peptide synthetase component F|nr:AMP-binding protein [Candidatus Methanovirga basalitermitum]
MSIDEKEELIILINKLNDTYIDNNTDDRTVVDLFEQRSKNTPDRIALVYKGEKLSYYELNLKVNMLANYLSDKGYLSLSSSCFLPLVFDRSPYMIIAILAVIKLSCAYVPVAPNNPVERTRHILSDTGAEIILTDNNNYENVIDIVKTIDLIEIVNVEKLFTANKLESISSSDLMIKPSVNDLVYMIYTSGTTGTPKKRCDDRA